MIAWFISLTWRQWLLAALYPGMIIMAGLWFYSLVAPEFRYYGRHRWSAGGRHRA